MNPVLNHLFLSPELAVVSSSLASSLFLCPFLTTFTPSSKEASVFRSWVSHFSHRPRPSPSMLRHSLQRGTHVHAKARTHSQAHMHHIKAWPASFESLAFGQDTLTGVKTQAPRTLKSLREELSLQLPFNRAKTLHPAYNILPTPTWWTHLVLWRNVLNFRAVICVI